jgi:molybdopterin converting factor small subunit
MELEIALFAGLVCSNPDLPCHGEKEFSQEFPDGITVRQLRDLLGIDPVLPLLAMVNNHGEAEDLVLKSGDRVALFPPIGGGQG